jgi:hypothetical protein
VNDIYQFTSVISMTNIGELGTTLAVNSKRSTLHLSVAIIANVPSSPILVILMMKEISSCKTSVLPRATWDNILEDGISNCVTSL